jgi:putative ABC transport system permease protein
MMLSPEILSGLSQALIAAVLVMGVTLLARTRDIHMEREVLIAMLRGILQIVIVGSVLVLVLQGPGFTSVLILLGMMLAAATIASRRARGIDGAFQVSLYGISLGSGVVIALMTATGVIETAMTSLIPIGSMLVANAMNSNALALDRFKSEVQAHTGEIEAGLALGADPRLVVTPYVRAAVHASMIPRVDTLRSLGIVWIPGVMAGMILAGSDPVYAAIYQFVVIAMIFSASALTSLISTLLIRSRAFSPAEQLVLRKAG